MLTNKKKLIKDKYSWIKFHHRYLLVFPHFLAWLCSDPSPYASQSPRRQTCREGGCTWAAPDSGNSVWLCGDPKTETVLRPPKQAGRVTQHCLSVAFRSELDYKSSESNSDFYFCLHFLANALLLPVRSLTPSSRRETWRLLAPCWELRPSAGTHVS